MAVLSQSVLDGIKNAEPNGVTPRYQYDRVPEHEIVTQVFECMAANGITPRDDLVLNFDTDKIERFPVEGDRGSERSGWYVLYSDGCPAGEVGDWHTGGVKFVFDFSRLGSGYEHIKQQAKTPEFQAEARRLHEERDNRRIEAQARAADEARAYFNTASAAPASHAYLVKKGVASHGLKIDGGGNLLVPLIGEDGKFKTIQRIATDGIKRFEPGTSSAGAFYVVEEGEKPRAVLIAEGYATAASVAESLGKSYKVVMAVNAGNMKSVCRTFKTKYPTLPVYIIGDDDAGKALELDAMGRNKPNTGKKKAAECIAERVADKAFFPPFDRNDDGWNVTDWNDYAGIYGKDGIRQKLGGEIERALPKPWLRPIGELIKDIRPPRWLIRDWLPDNSTIMLFGPSGLGKSLVAIDMALSIACPMVLDWHGFASEDGPVVYLAGEGHDGITRRMMGWLLSNGLKAPKTFDELPLVVSSYARDLDAEGARAAIEHIKELGISAPRLIVIDTIHRHMPGDENKAQDVHDFLTACETIRQEFSCSILYVHHTGVSQDAQGRARGSSAWKGAMDMEICLSSQVDGFSVEQTKNKDGKLQTPICFERKEVTLPGLMDQYQRETTTAIIELVSNSDVERPKKTKPMSAKDRKIQFARKTYVQAAKLKPRLDEDEEFIGISVEDWRGEFYKHATQDTQNGKKKAFQYARDHLIEAGLLEKTQADDGADVYTPLGSGQAWPELFLNHPFKGWHDSGQVEETGA